MRTLAASLLALVLVAPIACAQSPASPLAVDTTPINRIEQDSTGQVWGVDSPSRGDLYRWENDRWNIAPVEGIATDSRPAALTTGPDGAVYCLWTSRESSQAIGQTIGQTSGQTAGEQTVTWHKGSESKTLAHFSGDLDAFSNIFVDAQKNVWLTGRSLHIYRVTPEGKAGSVYTVDYDHRYDTNQPRNIRMMFATIHATADGQGRVWFWAGQPPGGVPSLDGILIFDGQKFVLHPGMPGPPNRRYNWIEPDGPQHMWVAGTMDHLYRVDIQTMDADVLTEPAQNVFRFAQRVFHGDGATYVLSVEGSMPIADPSAGGRIGALWQLENSEWKRLLNGIDMRPRTSNDSARSFAVTPAGLWLGAYGGGPWLIPAGSGEPVQIDWRYGFPLEDSECLAVLPDGRLLVVAENTGTTTFKPHDLIAAYRPPKHVQTLNPPRVFVPDRNNHLWGFLSGDSAAISEWDGKTWTDHSLPESLPPVSALGYGMDSQDRIWIMRGPCGGPVVIFNPASGKIEDFADFPAAYQAQLPSGGAVHVHGERFPVTTFTPDGKIGYNDGCGQVRYFDGRNWHSWRAQDIDISRRQGFEGQAFFDRAGNFAINMGGRTWEYSAEQGWRMTSYESSGGPDQIGRPERLLPPPGCQIPNPQSVVRDRLGTYWIVSEGQLYRAVPGLCVAQFAPDEHQPFVDSRILKGVLIDPQGNAFLETYLRRNPNFGEYVILNARHPLPETKLQATVDEAGAVALKFTTATPGKVLFTWRVDHGDWSTPSPGAEATLNEVPEGRHTVEAAALDEHLQIDPRPAVAEVAIHPIAQAQLAALIEQLKNPNYAKRDAAVAALARRPDLALPLLQSAREKADPDQRWWIDAAIQRIQDQAAKAKQP